MELAALPGHAREDRPAGGFEARVIVTDKAPNPAQATSLQRIEKLPPMHLGLAQSNAHAKDGAFARRSDPGGDEHRTVKHPSVLADLLVTGIQIDVGHDRQGRVAPGIEMHVEFGGAVADMSGTDRMTAELLDDLSHATSGDALDVHLGQGEFEGLFTAQSLVESRRVKLQFAANRWHGQFERTHASINRLGFEAVGVADSGVGAFVRLCAQSFGTLAEHGFVEQGGEAAEQGFGSGFVELLQDGVQEIRVVLVGHTGCVC